MFFSEQAVFSLFILRAASLHPVTRLNKENDASRVPTTSLRLCPDMTTGTAMGE